MPKINYETNFTFKGSRSEHKKLDSDLGKIVDKMIEFGQKWNVDLAFKITNPKEAKNANR